MRQKGYKPYAGRKKRLWVKCLAALIALGLLCFAALEVYIGVHSRTDIIGNPQTMVIFGCQVKPWGPSILLQDRLDTALSYLEDHPDMNIVVAGGKGDDEHMSEAQCMYDYLTAHGVDGENIHMEPQSRNTWQNVNYTLDLMGEVGTTPRGRRKDWSPAARCCWCPAASTWPGSGCCGRGPEDIWRRPPPWPPR